MYVVIQVNVLLSGFIRRKIVHAAAHARDVILPIQVDVSDNVETKHDESVLGVGPIEIEMAILRFLYSIF